jgi:hypothetical protein
MSRLKKNAKRGISIQACGPCFPGCYSCYSFVAGWKARSTEIDRARQLRLSQNRKLKHNRGTPACLDGKSPPTPLWQRGGRGGFFFAFGKQSCYDLARSPSFETLSIWSSAIKELTAGETNLGLNPLKSLACADSSRARTIGHCRPCHSPVDDSLGLSLRETIDLPKPGSVRAPHPVPQRRA